MPDAAENPRVFIVDDEKPLTMAMWRGLPRTFDLLLTHSARFALDVLNADVDFDVVLLDIVMPDLNGLTLFEKLRATAPARADRIVFMTGGLQIPAVADYLRGLDNRVLEKPFTLDEAERIVSIYSSMYTPRGPR